MDDILNMLAETQRDVLVSVYVLDAHQCCIAKSALKGCLRRAEDDANKWHIGDGMFVTNKSTTVSIYSYGVYINCFFHAA